MDGSFEAGAVVLVNQDVKIISAYSSAELESIRGKHSTQAAALLGQPENGDGSSVNVARPEDMAWLVD